MSKTIKPYLISSREEDEIKRHYINTREQNEENIPTIISGISEFFGKVAKTNQPKRLLLYCHGGLVNQKKGIHLVKNHYSKIKDNNIYPVYFIWESGPCDTLEQMFNSIQSEFQNYNLINEIKEKTQVQFNNKKAPMQFDGVCKAAPYALTNEKEIKEIGEILEEVHQSMTSQTMSADRYMAPSFLNKLSEFVQKLTDKVKNEIEAIEGEFDDICNNIVQHIARNYSLYGKRISDVWAEMKETGEKIFQDGGDGDIFLSEFLKRFKDDNIEIHIVGHSAGSIVLSTLLKRLNQKESQLQGLKIKSCTLMAAACTETLFNTEYVSAFKNRLIENFFFYTLSDALEQADKSCIIYRKSLLYAISEFLESSSEPKKIIGMEIYARDNEFIKSLKDSKQRAAWVISQRDHKEFIGSKETVRLISKSKEHGDFDNDTSTMNSVIKSIVGSENIHSYSPNSNEFFKDSEIHPIKL